MEFKPVRDVVQAQKTVPAWHRAMPLGFRYRKPDLTPKVFAEVFPVLMPILRFAPSSCAMLCSTSLAAADTLDELRQRGTLRWGADREGGGPYVFPRNDDPTQIQGFEVELAELLARRLGVKAEFAQGQWDKLPDLLDRGDVDIVMNGYEWTANRSQRYGCSIPYYLYELQLLARQDDARIKSLDDLDRFVRRAENASGGTRRIGGSILSGGTLP